MMKIWIIVWLSLTTLCLSQPVWVCQGLASSCDKIEELQGNVKSLGDEKLQQEEDLSEKIEELKRNVKSMGKEKMQLEEDLFEKSV